MNISLYGVCMHLFFVRAVATVDIFGEVLRTRMVLTRCIPPFSTNSMFKRLDLNLKVHCGGHIQQFYRLENTIDITTAREEFHRVKSTLFSLKLGEIDSNECDIVIGLAKKLAPLCSDVLLENTAAGLSGGPIGIGLVDTWHGTPDMRLISEPGEYIEALVKEDDVELDGSEVEEDPDPDSDFRFPTEVPGHVAVNKNIRIELSQLVGMTVVSSFTNANLNRGHVTAALLLCCKKVQLCIYDCVNDVLSLSDEVPLVNQDGSTSHHGAILIWIALHFRYTHKQARYTVVCVSVCVDCHIAVPTINEVLHRISIN